MSTIATPAEAEAEIRAVMDARIAAVRAKDAAAVVMHHAEDIVCYDLLDPLRHRGVGRVRERAQQWFDGYDGPIGYEIEDLQVVPAFEVAFCYGVHHATGTTREGRKVDMHWRSTQVFQRLGGKWRIMHERGSVPR